MKKAIFALLFAILLVFAVSAAFADDIFVQVTKNASIRDTAGYDSEKVRLAEEGEIFQCLDEDGSWYEIAFDGSSVGFLPKSSCEPVSLSEEAAAAIKSGNAVSPAVRIKKITLSETKQFTLPVGMSYRLTAIIEPANADVNDIEWSSSNTKVATIDATGLIQAVGKGNTTITATAKNGSKAKATVKVQVEEFDLVFYDKTPQQQSLYTTSYGGENIKYSTKNKTVEISFYGIGTTISGAGISYQTTFQITPVKAGTDTITFRYGSSRINVQIYVSPDVFSPPKEDYTKAPESTDLNAPAPLGEIEDYTFFGIPWGSSYEEAASILEKKDNIRIYALVKDGGYWISQTSYSSVGKIMIGDKKASNVDLSFLADEDDETLNSRLFQVYCRFQNIQGNDVILMKNEMIRRYGKPVKDDIKQAPDSGTHVCVWEKGAAKITLYARGYTSTVDVVYNYSPQE